VECVLYSHSQRYLPGGWHHTNGGRICGDAPGGALLLRLLRAGEHDRG